MTQVIFEEESHIYYKLVENRRILGLSATTFISEYKQKYDEKFWSYYTALRIKLGFDKAQFSEYLRGCGFKFYMLNGHYIQQERIEYLIDCVGPVAILQRKQVDDVLAEWKEAKELACSVGTAFHEYKEEQAYLTGIEMIGNKQVELSPTAVYTGDKTKRVSKDLRKLGDGYHAELLLYLDDVVIDGIKYDSFLVGQCDKTYIETIGNVRYVDLDDYKTNKEIKMSNKFQKMLPPLSNLEDCTIVHYNIQLSIYAYILEQYGYVIRNLYVSHHDIKEIGMTTELKVSDIGKEKLIVLPVKYKRREVEKMIIHRFNGVKIEVPVKPTSIARPMASNNRTKFYTDFMDFDNVI